MSIRKRVWLGGKEAWQVDLLVGKNRIRKQFPTKADAKAYELEVRRRAKDGTFLADGSKVLVRQLATDFTGTLEKRRDRGARMSPLHFKSQDGHLRNYIVGGTKIRDGKESRVFDHGLGNYLLSDLTAEVADNFYNHLQDHGLSLKTIREIKNTLSGLLDYALKKKLIGINPALGLRFISDSLKTRKRKITVPSKELVNRLISCPDLDPEISFKIKFAALTGMRASEQWALRWKHVDFRRGYVRVETRVDSMTFTENHTKTEAGDRDIPIAGLLASELAQWKKDSPYQGADCLVFPNADGGYTRQGVMLKTFYRIYETAIIGWPDNLPPPSRPRWHDLRHFAISCWIEAGLPAKAIQDFAGHASLQMTMDRYGHLFPSADHHLHMDSVLLAVQRCESSTAQ